MHLYTQPVPEGFSDLTVALEGVDRLRADPVTVAQGEEFHVEGLPETFYVVEGRIHLVLPFILLSNRDTAGDAIQDIPLRLSLELSGLYI